MPFNGLSDTGSCQQSQMVINHGKMLSFIWIILIYSWLPSIFYIRNFAEACMVKAQTLSGLVFPGLVASNSDTTKLFAVMGSPLV